MIEEIRDLATMEGSEGLIAIVITQSEGVSTPNGVNFITDKDAEMQVAFIKHPMGKVVDAHTHPPRTRVLNRTQEVLVIQNGHLQVDFYTHTGTLLTSRFLKQGDVVILVGGGHGFLAETDVEFTEVRTGPYFGGEDKIRFQKETL